MRRRRSSIIVITVTIVVCLKVFHEFITILHLIFYYVLRVRILAMLRIRVQQRRRRTERRGLVAILMGSGWISIGKNNRKYNQN